MRRYGLLWVAVGGRDVCSPMPDVMIDVQVNIYPHVLSVGCRCLVAARSLGLAQCVEMDIIS